MMALPAELEPAFEQAMITIEQEHKMAFVTSIERLSERRGLEKGLEQGIEQGRYKGLREGEALMLQRQLSRKSGPLPEAQKQRIWAATPEQLETWSLNILDAETLDDVFAA
ncbi:transposase [Pollutimonas subterranea]|uniref:Transposase n=2 Tax=Pollutimonas subterranea TaxID=2045210 RepID=A0A2N4TZG7_9BURK|nr:transposase [Pollutimonas subterranea]